MRGNRLRTFLLVVGVTLPLVTAGVPAQAQGDGRLFASTGVPLPEGAQLIGAVTAPTPAGGGHQIDMSGLYELARRVPSVPPPPCVAAQAWAKSGTALTGYLYLVTDPQSGHTTADVMWWTDDGDFDPETDEGIVAFASADCATKLVYDWSITDVSNMPGCLPESASSAGDEFEGPFTEPIYTIFGMGWVPYFSVDPSSTEVPCTRATSTVIFKAHVSYVEKNRGTKVPIGCYQRSWNVRFTPGIGDDPMNPEVSWLKVSEASPETTCVSGT